MAAARTTPHTLPASTSTWRRRTGRPRWDPDDLPVSTGAEGFEWLGMTPILRYRLIFLPDTDVTVEES